MCRKYSAFAKKLFRTARKNAKGFTLIEVLISITILSVGMLGVASMQLTALSSNAKSRDDTVVVQLVEEMVERIRVNGGNNPGIYHGINTANTCTGSDPAKGDCTQWKQRMADTRLPGLTGTVSVVTESPIEKTSTITVQVTWGAGTTKTLQFATIMETWGT